MTHLPNELALKMDGAKACDRYSTIIIKGNSDEQEGVDVVRSLDVSLGGTASSADLGGSSKQPIGNVGGRSGEGFPENSNWSGVTRS